MDNSEPKAPDSQQDTGESATPAKKKRGSPSHKKKRTKYGKRDDIGNILTPREIEFCSLLNQGVAVSEVEDQMKLSRGGGYALLKRNRVQKYLDDLRVATRKELIAKTAKETAKIQIVTRAEIIDGMLDIARTEPKFTNGTLNAQIKAWENLAKIHGMMVERSVDLTKMFDGRTEDELNFFAVNGYWPDHVGSN